MKLTNKWSEKFMKNKHVILGAALLLITSSALSQTIVYQQNFESGLQPPEFETWSGGSFAGMWGFSPALDGRFSLAIQEDVPGYDFATFCQFPQALNTLTVSFEFSCPQFPTEYALEMVDLYDADGNEVCDVYLDTDGQLSLTIGGSIGTAAKPIPLNQTVTVTVHFSDAAQPGSASLTWSQKHGPFGGEINGVYRVDGNYSSAVTHLLFGPVESPVMFVYDDLLVTAP